MRYPTDSGWRGTRPGCWHERLASCWRRSEGRGPGQGSLAGDQPPGAGDDAHAGAADRGAQAAGAGVHRAGGEADTALDPRGDAAGRRRAPARSRAGREAKLRQIQKLETFIARSERVAEQIRKRMRGEKITNRLVSIFDPDARPIRKGKLGKPNEFGFVAQLAELSREHPPRRARADHPRRRQPDRLAQRARPAAGHRRRARPPEPPPARGRARRRLLPAASPRTCPSPQRRSSPGRQRPARGAPHRRLARYRVGIEGRISHLKRRYGLRRSRLKGHHGARTWTAWAILAYNLDTLAIRAA